MKVLKLDTKEVKGKYSIVLEIESKNGTMFTLASSPKYRNRKDALQIAQEISKQINKIQL